MECQSGGSLSRIERTTDVRVTNKILGECTICDFASLIQEPSIQNFGITYRKPLLGTSLLEGFWTHMAGLIHVLDVMVYHLVAKQKILVVIVC
jgi:hypothetical protein